MKRCRGYSAYPALTRASECASAHKRALRIDAGSIQPAVTSGLSVPDRLECKQASARSVAIGRIFTFSDEEMGLY
jgi:hypothetical protein